MLLGYRYGLYPAHPSPRGDLRNSIAPLTTFRESNMTLRRQRPSSNYWQGDPPWQLPSPTAIKICSRNAHSAASPPLCPTAARKLRQSGLISKTERYLSTPHLAARKTRTYAAIPALPSRSSIPTILTATWKSGVG